MAELAARHGYTMDGLSLTATEEDSRSGTASRDGGSFDGTFHHRGGRSSADPSPMSSFGGGGGGGGQHGGGWLPEEGGSAASWRSAAEPRRKAGLSPHFPKPSRRFVFL